MTAFMFVMPGLVPGIHDFNTSRKTDVDGRDEPGHDVESLFVKHQRCASRHARTP
jgi:hypothetical protein